MKAKVFLMTTLIIPTVGVFGLVFKEGMLYQSNIDLKTYRYSLHAEQLTANDIPVIFTDELPGIGGTKERPDTCLAYYIPAKQSDTLYYLTR